MKLKLNEQGHAVLQDGKPVYVYEDGREVAFDAPATVSKIAALNAEAKSHRERFEEAAAKLKAFEGIDDADAARKALETMRNVDEGKLIAAGKVEEIKAAAKKAAEEQVAAANKAHAEELARTKADRDRFASDLYAEKIGGAFTRSKMFQKDSDSRLKFAVPPDMVQARFGSSFKVEDGRVVAYDPNGNKIFSRSKPGELADFDEALETLVESYPYKDQILAGSGASGSGASGSGGAGSKTMTMTQFNQLKPAERAAAMQNGTTLIDG